MINGCPLVANSRFELECIVLGIEPKANQNTKVQNNHGTLRHRGTPLPPAATKKVQLWKSVRLPCQDFG